MRTIIRVGMKDNRQKSTLTIKRAEILPLITTFVSTSVEQRPLNPVSRFRMWTDLRMDPLLTDQSNESKLIASIYFNTRIEHINVSLLFEKNNLETTRVQANNDFITFRKRFWKTFDPLIAIEIVTLFVSFGKKIRKNFFNIKK